MLHVENNVYVITSLHLQRLRRYFFGILDRADLKKNYFLKNKMKITGEF